LLLMLALPIQIMRLPSWIVVRQYYQCDDDKQYYLQLEQWAIRAGSHHGRSPRHYA
jgi:hypothetical protein